MFGGFKGTKLKPQLKMAVSRFAIASNKKSAIMKQNMREVALLLAEDPPKEEKARIRAEALIRDDNMIEAYEILQLECELLSERIKLLESQKQCPPDLLSCISDLIYACPRVDIPELNEIRKQFRAKYGKDFEKAALENKGGVLNERVVSKLSVHPPAAYLVQTYLEKIAEQYEVDWQPTIKLSSEQMIEPMAAPVGYSVQAAQGTGLGPDAQAMTGTQNSDEEIGFSKLDAIPPPAPGFGGGTASVSGGGSGPVVSATPYQSPKNTDNLPTTTAYVNGGASTTSSVTQPTTANNMNGTPSAPSAASDYDEVDIFVPTIPTAPPGGVSPMNGNKSQDDDDDDQKPPAAGGSSGGSTYEDLAARFEQLKK
ncbi:IST1 homolog [Seminavis robusta]|uniref:IST1 homolog n=1 Tax=Seminavis robusta TaxID=568900 RepID=A0A9N8DRV3_9STRA|nr:IST1 homolog [Seminavis robusta]|eukprot:Sro244_g097100.1 IST1 homolog (369) ;mRNA; r:18854-20147